MRRIDLRRSDGVAMTEFALILPIFMVIVAGLLGFGAAVGGLGALLLRRRQPSR